MIHAQREKEKQGQIGTLRLTSLYKIFQEFLKNIHCSDVGDKWSYFIRTSYLTFVHTKRLSAEYLSIYDSVWQAKL